MPHDYTRSRASADKMLKRWGAPALLRSAAGDRSCTAFITSFNPQERVGKLTNPLDKKALISALAPDGSVLVPPDNESEQLVTLDPVTGVETGTLTITEPPDAVDPAGIACLYQLAVRK